MSSSTSLEPRRRADGGNSPDVVEGSEGSDSSVQSESEAAESTPNSGEDSANSDDNNYAVCEGEEGIQAQTPKKKVVKRRRSRLLNDGDKAAIFPIELDEFAEESPSGTLCSKLYGEEMHTSLVETILELRKEVSSLQKDMNEGLRAIEERETLAAETCKQAYGDLAKLELKVLKLEEERERLLSRKVSRCALTSPRPFEEEFGDIAFPKIRQSLTLL